MRCSYFLFLYEELENFWEICVQFWGNSLVLGEQCDIAGIPLQPTSENSRRVAAWLHGFLLCCRNGVISSSNETLSFANECKSFNLEKKLHSSFVKLLKSVYVSIQRSWMKSMFWMLIELEFNVLKLKEESSLGMLHLHEKRRALPALFTQNNTLKTTIYVNYFISYLYWQEGLFINKICNKLFTFLKWSDPSCSFLFFCSLPESQIWPETTSWEILLKNCNNSHALWCFLFHLLRIKAIWGHMLPSILSDTKRMHVNHLTMLKWSLSYHVKVSPNDVMCWYGPAAVSVGSSLSVPVNKQRCADFITFTTTKGLGQYLS